MFGLATRDLDDFDIEETQDCLNHSAKVLANVNNSVRITGHQDVSGFRGYEIWHVSVSFAGSVLR